MWKVIHLNVWDILYYRKVDRVTITYRALLIFDMIRNFVS